MSSVELNVSTNDKHPESVTLKKGTLWQQRDKLFSRWKERFFVLTSDYLACFKKASKIGISEMGGFLYKVNLADVNDLQWIDKKQDGVIAVKVAQEDQLLLWSAKGLDNWMFALRDAVNLSKGRREALRRSQTLMPQMSDGLISRHRLSSQHSLADTPSGLVHSGSNIELCSSVGPFIRTVADKRFMPSISEYARRMSVLTESESIGDADCDVAATCDYYPLTHHAFGPRLAPQCSSGSHSSLVALGQHSENGHLYKPSPRSLQVSPALTQRSLYAQYILSSPEISHSESRRTKSWATSATSEFSFVNPDSPTSSLRVKHNRPSIHQATPQKQCQDKTSGSYYRPSSAYGQSFISIDNTTNSQSLPPDVVPVHNFNQADKLILPKKPLWSCNQMKSNSAFIDEKLKTVESSSVACSAQNSVLL